MTTEPATSQQPSENNAYQWKALIVVAMGNFLVTMDASITNIAFPAFTKTFQAELTTVIWVTLAYILTSASSMLIIGKFSDVTGRKRIFVTGVGLFTLGLILCSSAQNIGQLIAFRILQAMGASMVYSTSNAIVAEAFTPNHSGKGLGYLSMSIGAGFIAGPILGGFLLDWLDWRSIFYMRVPVSLFTFFLSLFFLKKDRIKRKVIKLDLPGIITSSIGIFLLVFGTGKVREHGTTLSYIHALMGLGLIFIIIFILLERKAEDPILDLGLFKNSAFSSAGLALFLFFIAYPSFIILMPFFLIQGYGMNSSGAGLLLSVMAIASTIIGPLSGTLSDRFGSQKFSTILAGIVILGYCIMLSFGIQTSVAAFIGGFALFGIGIGGFLTTSNIALMNSASRDHLGTASAFIAILRQVGMALGTALCGTLFSARRSFHASLIKDETISEAAKVNLAIPPAFHDVIVLAIVLQCIVFILCFVRGKKSILPFLNKKGERL